MEAARCRELFAGSPVARLATVTGEGWPHLVPVVVALLPWEEGGGEGWPGDRVVTAVDAKPKSTRRLRRLDNVRATGRASLLVDHYDADWSRLWWVRADGPARVVAADGKLGAAAVRALEARHPQYRSAPPAGPVVVVDVARWVGWSASGR